MSVSGLNARVTIHGTGIMVTNCQAGTCLILVWEDPRNERSELCGTGDLADGESKSVLTFKVTSDIL
jgi:hypothetical protein